MDKTLRLLLPRLKANLIVDHDDDDALLLDMLAAAIAYAEGFQHRMAGHYAAESMPPSTAQAVIMLASHFYESRDASTGGYFNDRPEAAQQTRRTVNDLLRLDRVW